MEEEMEDQQTSMSPYDLNRIVAETAKAKVTEYLTSKEFKDKAKKEYTTQITAMIESAEKKARFWAIVVTLLVIGLALVLVSSEFYKVKEKRLSLDEEYVKVLVTAQELRKTIDALRSETERAKAEAETKDKAIRATIKTIEKKTKYLEGRIDQGIARVDKKK
jgi:uncharacterized small protein (DUF1192 family)